MSEQQYRPSSFQILPPVVKNLLIINCIFFLAKFALAQSGIVPDLSDKLGMHYFFASKFKIYQAITYMFMHADITHIFFNMFALWMFGNTLENLWGPKRFLTFFIITGVGAALTHYTYFYFHDLKPVFETIDAYVAAPDEQGTTALIEYFRTNIPRTEDANEMIDHFNEYVRVLNSFEATKNIQGMINASLEYSNTYKNDLMNLPVVVGASGAIFGILLAFGMLFPNTMLYVYFAIPVKAKYFVIIYGLIELVSGIMNNPTDNVAHFAHLGGMLFGFILIKVWQKKRNNFF